MNKQPLERLTWHASETVQAIPGLLETSQQIEILLPANYNHALFRTLHPDVPTPATEKLNADAGPELLSQIAKVKGLEGLSKLVPDLKRHQARVRLISPPTLIIDVTRHEK